MSATEAPAPLSVPEEEEELHADDSKEVQDPLSAWMSFFIS